MAPRFFSLSAVTRRLTELLEPALSAMFWVRAEISSGTERGGAFYCDLVESDAQGRVRAQLRCTIWPLELSRMRAKFAAAGLALELADGSVVGLQCRVQFHARYGLSLSGIEMDPAVALGELELQRRRILEALTREGLLERNARLEPPLLPNRIALVTSAASAACGDFVETLTGSDFGFRIFLADVSVQGVEAEARILEALDRSARLEVDLVVIVRGGGTRTDLAWLDNEAIARRIAAMPLPVWTGIGHEADQSVLDAVAARAFKTPTGVAEELVARFSGVEALVRGAGRQLRSFWRMRQGHERQLLEHASTGLRQGTRKLLDVHTASLRADANQLRGRLAKRLSDQHARLAGARSALQARAEARVARLRLQLRDVLGRRFRPSLVLQRFEREGRALAQALRALRAVDPAAALARGFSLVYNAEGELVRSVEDLVTGQSTLTRLSDGDVESVVKKILEGQNV